MAKTRTSPPSVAKTRAERVTALLAGTRNVLSLEQIVDTLVLALASDRKIHAMEMGEAIAIVTKLPAWRGSDAKEIEAKVKASAGALVQSGRKSRIQSLAAALASDEQREEAFRLVVAMHYADAQVEDEEDKVLRAFRNTLGIDSERADVLIADVETRLFH